MANIGRIKQIIGPVVDVAFDTPGSTIPKILNALVVKRPEGDLVLECQRHLGEDSVRAIAMDATDGLTRGMEVVDTGETIAMPVGIEIRGRLFNVIGEAIDGIGQVSKAQSYPIHRNPPRFEDLYRNRNTLHRY